MCVTWSNSGLFSTPGFIVSAVGERERGGGDKREKKRREGGKMGIVKERKEGRRSKGDRRQDKKEF